MSKKKKNKKFKFEINQQFWNETPFYMIKLPLLLLALALGILFARYVFPKNDNVSKQANLSNVKEFDYNKINDSTFAITIIFKNDSVLCGVLSTHSDINLLINNIK